MLIPAIAGHQAAIAALSGAWTPASLPNLVGWWDASNTGSLTTETGGRVTQWNDLSGSGNHLTAASASTARPTSGTRTINSLNVLDFDGSANAMEATGVSAIPANRTYLAVILFDTSTGTICAGGSSSVVGFDWDLNSGKQRIVKQNIAVIALSTSTLSTATAYKIGASRVDGGSWALYTAGAADGSGTVATTWGATADHLVVGRNGGGTFLNGVLGELVACDAILSSTDLASFWTYCAKWGL